MVYLTEKLIDHCEAHIRRSYILAHVKEEEMNDTSNTPQGRKRRNPYLLITLLLTTTVMASGCLNRPASPMQTTTATSEESVSESETTHTEQETEETTEEVVATTETEATTEETTPETEQSTETSEHTVETTEQTSEPTPKLSPEPTTEGTSPTPETPVFSELAEELARELYPSPSELSRNPLLARQYFPLETLNEADTSWDDWTWEEWTEFLLKQSTEYIELHHSTEPSEPRTEPTDPRPIITPTLMPAREPTFSLVSESPDGRTGDELNEAFELDGIVIVNKQHWVSEDYKPLPDSENRWGLIPEARAAFDTMKADAAEDGLTLVFASGYRTYALQEHLFNDYSANNPNGEEGANRSSARPGQSEHHTGLALDIRNETDGLTLAFGRSDEGRWLW